ncbi:WLM-domain-containing protein [Myriangium duriaei CBS 260.36]|uniref:WLM-domain-containing protein n=1 Tax=Myriangium duriaei CBS 260.36 TaxID=1168546 RepID=A0A9P4IXC0_9PEZI|nr:WLM-domain-containing protein [Myriangium duriaei CBS 260.36]
MEPSFRGPGGSWAGGPSQSQRNFASNLHEQDSLISTYEHLTSLPDPAEALLRLRKIASLVKPIMRKRGWHVGTLTEFLPEDQRLLGLNVNRGQKICIRLRYSSSPKLFLPIEQCVDTMLHELSHIIFGPHDTKFHALWDELRSEHETLLLRGYTGQGFLTKGQRLGGGHMPPTQEIRRLARQNAENTRKSQKGKGALGGFRLGGKRILPGQDPRKVIADAIDQRNTINRGCASNNPDADRLASQPTQQIFKTVSKEDDANDRAIAEALLELMEEEEYHKLERGDSAYQGLSWNPETGLYLDPKTGRQSTAAVVHMSEEDQMRWAISESMKATSSRPGNLRSRSTQSPEGLSDLAAAITAASAPTWKADVQRIKRKPTNRSVTAPVIVPRLHIDPPESPSKEDPGWTCDICTCVNKPDYLTCDACGLERTPISMNASPMSASALPSTNLRGSSAAQNLDRVNRQAAVLRTPETMGWTCRRCATFMEHKYWTCSACGLMKSDSSANEHAG